METDMTTPSPLLVNLAARSSSGTRHLTRRIVACPLCGATGSHQAAHADEPDGPCVFCEGSGRLIEERLTGDRWVAIGAGDRRSIHLAGFDPVEARDRFETHPTGPIKPAAPSDDLPF